MINVQRGIEAYCTTSSPFPPATGARFRGEPSAPRELASRSTVKTAFRDVREDLFTNVANCCCSIRSLSLESVESLSTSSYSLTDSAELSTLSFTRASDVDSASAFRSALSSLHGTDAWASGRSLNREDSLSS
ncbi:hypothetical protein DQ04_06501040 [Trypanosoma grayi]|uniref:hypothetical protein n=1 Tax=Trypanosoma grayi TaxID=71804 RepID=UPI0004F44885|nr:hypothetical protein DQ04_06501040 [Trypanosoma grayi]KEG08758.1 hypothetical protein DQ04_06501040 [Trypanosoma grayi]